MLHFRTQQSQRYILYKCVHIIYEYIHQCAMHTHVIKAHKRYFSFLVL